MDGAGLGPLQRGIIVLRTLAMGGRKGVPLTHLSEQTGMTHSTVHRLLKQMLRERLVQQDPETRRYQLGSLAFELGLAAERQFNLRRLCRPVVQKLAQDSEDAVYLVQRSGNESVCLDRQEGPFPIRVLTLDVGGRRPLGLAAGGLAILAALPDDERAEVLSVVRPIIESQWDLSEDSLERSIARTRRDGYAVIRNRITAGTTAVAVHIRDDMGRPIAALAIAAVNARMQQARMERLHHMLHASAREIERLLVP
jgi:DNA-binding IclR family transcriptional regulator